MQRPAQLVVEDPKAAELLLDEGERAFVNHFFEKPKTVAELAQLLDYDRRKLLYRVKRLQDLRLLRVVKVERRAGRPVKHYQTSAERFIVSYAASSAATPAEFFEMVSASMLHEAFYDNYLPASEAHRFGVAISHDDKGGLVRLAAVQNGTWRLQGPENGPFAILRFDVLALSDEDIVALRQELLDILERYRAKEMEGNPPRAIIRLGLAKIRKR